MDVKQPEQVLISPPDQKISITPWQALRPLDLCLGRQRIIAKIAIGYVIVIQLWLSTTTPNLACPLLLSYPTQTIRYADLGIRYYAVYLPNPSGRRKRLPLEIYVLENGKYQLLGGDTPVWLPEIGLKLGRARGTYLGREREWLYWYDEAGNRLLTPEERAAQAQERALQAQEKAEKLAEQLRRLGIEPDAV